MPESTDIWKSEAEELRARVKHLTIQCQAQQELIQVSLSLTHSLLYAFVGASINICTFVPVKQVS